MNDKVHRLKQNFISVSSKYFEEKNNLSSNYSKELETFKLKYKTELQNLEKEYSQKTETENSRHKQEMASIIEDNDAALKDLQNQFTQNTEQNEDLYNNSKTAEKNKYQDTCKSITNTLKQSVNQAQNDYDTLKNKYTEEFKQSKKALTEKVNKSELKFIETYEAKIKNLKEAEAIENDKLKLDFRLQEEIIINYPVISSIESFWKGSQHFHNSDYYSSKKNEEAKSFHTVKLLNDSFLEQLSSAGWDTHTNINSESLQDEKAGNNILTLYHEYLSNFHNQLHNTYKDFGRTDHYVKSRKLYNNTIIAMIVLFILGLSIFSQVIGLSLLMIISSAGILVSSIIALSNKTASILALRESFHSVCESWRKLEATFNKISDSNQAVGNLLDEYSAVLKSYNPNSNRYLYVENSCAFAKAKIDELRSDSIYKQTYNGKRLSPQELEIIPQIVSLHLKYATRQKELTQQHKNELTMLKSKLEADHNNLETKSKDLLKQIKKDLGKKLSSFENESKTNTELENLRHMETMETLTRDYKAHKTNCKNHLTDRSSQIDSQKNAQIQDDNSKHAEFCQNALAAYQKRKTLLEESNSTNNLKLKQESEVKLSRLNEQFMQQKKEISDSLAAIRSEITDLANFVRKTATFADSISYYIGEMSVSVNKEKQSFPLYYTLSDYKPMIVYASEKDKEIAINMVKSLLLRCLYKIPAGKCYCLFFDPIDLGKSFSEFMALADYDEQIVYHKIWTETDMLTRLLKEHKNMMENIIQFTLRKTYKSIEEYNSEYGSIQEPYRFLIISDFPTGFDTGYKEEALRLLQSIMRNGPRCGFHTILMVTDQLRPESGIRIKDLTDDPLEMHISNESLSIPNITDNSACSISLLTDKMHYAKVFDNIGSTIKQHKVTVEFEKLLEIAKFAQKDWHTGDSAKNITIPLGPAGAHRIQYLELGEGTRQHALIAGKTGSGKSTLLHIIIINLLIKYSPAEVELYLIDFKKGVEFKVYGDNKIPHARVIAIAGESEFGFSVLEFLNKQLDVRGKLFRSTGVENLSEYRSKTKLTMARIILIVDEFQEFFSDKSVNEDKAREFFNRLVRQGRAFGIHLILGTQSLSGTLSSEIKNQMAVRIALSCSDDDSRSILSDDNTAAKLLRHPGAAIYNPENGSIEGNHNFQVSWIQDDRRDYIIGKVVKKYSTFRHENDNKQYIFEGNAYSDLEHSFSQNQITEISGNSKFTLWLGEPISIGEPLTVHLNNTRSENILLVGRDSSVTQGLLGAMIFTACIQATWVKKLYIIDFSTPDSDFEKCIKLLDSQFPNTICYGKKKELSENILQLSKAVKSRTQSSTNPAEYESTIFVINQIQKARDIDIEFSNSMPFGDKSPEEILNEQLNLIIKEGPDVNIYTIINVDINANLKRRLSRQIIKEFDNKVCFQMSKEDSIELLNSYDASSLGLFKAVYVNEGNMTNFKFKPFKIPELDLIKKIVH
jgi:hypothetical protein